MASTSPQDFPSLWWRFRRHGIRPLKSILSSITDIVSDWLFFIRVRGGSDDLEKFELPIFVFAVVSSVMGALVIINMLSNIRKARKQYEKERMEIVNQMNSANEPNQNQTRSRATSKTYSAKYWNVKLSALDHRPTTLGGWVKFFLGLEMILEDIPQFILSAFVTSESGRLSSVVVFNITSSGFNFVLNLLDMIEVEPIQDSELIDETDTDDVKEGGNLAVIDSTDAGNGTVEATVA